MILSLIQSGTGISVLLNLAEDHFHVFDNRISFADFTSSFLQDGTDNAKAPALAGQFDLSDCG